MAPALMRLIVMCMSNLRKPCWLLTYGNRHAEKDWGCYAGVEADPRDGGDHKVHSVADGCPGKEGRENETSAKPCSITTEHHFLNFFPLP